MSTPISKCVRCNHYWIDKKRKCDAFPSGIPEEILFNEFNHIKKHPKQSNDIVFEPIKKEFYKT